MKLLIIEDNPGMRQLLKTIVADLAEATFECSDGEEAVAAYTAHQPDWVLMDLQLPRLSGLGAARQIKTAYPDARIIIITEYDDPHWRAAIQAAGACGYILKENLLEARRLLIS